MDQDGVGAIGQRGVDQRQAGGHAGDQPGDAPATLDLQAVWAKITDAPDIKQTSQIFRQLLAIH